MPRTIRGNIPKDIVSGIAITSLIFVISVYMPIIGFFCSLFIPLPTLFYRSKLGRTTGAFIPIITIIVMIAVLGGVSIDILFFVELILIGFALSEFIERDLSIENDNAIYMRFRDIFRYCRSALFTVIYQIKRVMPLSQNMYPKTSS